jgi:hypothetical protein
LRQQFYLDRISGNRGETVVFEREDIREQRREVVLEKENIREQS